MIAVPTEAVGSCRLSEPNKICEVLQHNLKIKLQIKIEHKHHDFKAKESIRKKLTENSKGEFT